MAALSSKMLVDALLRHQLLNSVDSAELQVLAAKFPEPKALAKELMRRGCLTAFQANQLLTGKAEELVLGKYILLERLGEGGMGQVFKARHRTLGRICAIKVIRKEMLKNADSVRRFHREVRSAAALSHPNIVLAYDADEIAGTHLMVMECVEGATDLAKLVKNGGPLPVERACEYIRQAALGLQHAFERGLVHRDIKPANLLLASDVKTIKVLDMGLARLSITEDDDSSAMTREGAVMGTPDYMAPEQALDTHSVDIRADIYSLGCSLYYLLTGQAPFPGGSLLQKLNKHQFDEPTAVEELRPEVTPEVAAVVRRLMAKKREQRYQTPAQAAAALAAACNVAAGVAAPRRHPASVEEGDGAVFEAALPGSGSSRDTLESAVSHVEKRDDTLAFDTSPSWKKLPSRPRWLYASLAGAACAVIGLGLAAVVLLVMRGRDEKSAQAKENGGVSTAKVSTKKTSRQADDAWLQEVALLPGDKQVEAVAKMLQELNPGFDGKVTHKLDNAGAVTELAFHSDKVADIAPVRALPALHTLNCSARAANGRLADLTPLKDSKLTSLTISGTTVSNLAPLAKLKLTSLSCEYTPVSDLTPLKDMKLTTLQCRQTHVVDLTSLKGMPLTTLGMALTSITDLTPLKDAKLAALICWGSQVSDLTPLKGMKLTTLACARTPVTDLSPLKGMPLKELDCDFRLHRDADVLRSIKTLTKINNKDAKTFWKDVDAQHAAFQAWLKEVAGMPADKQVEAVKFELAKRNPGFDVKSVVHKIDGDVVTELEFLTDNVTEIWPVRGVTGLRVLKCKGSAEGRGQLADLAPLKDLKLAHLTCDNTKVAHLTPLKDMKLTFLSCNYTHVADLTPLKDMKLNEVHCGNTHVADLAPLNGMKLTLLRCDATKVAALAPLKDMRLSSLNCARTRVSDLAPLKDMKLTTLLCANAPVTDLAPLRGMPLKVIDLDFKADRDAEILRSLATLEKINGNDAKVFWKAVNGK